MRIIPERFLWDGRLEGEVRHAPESYRKVVRATRFASGNAEHLFIALCPHAGDSPWGEVPSPVFFGDADVLSPGDDGAELAAELYLACALHALGVVGVGGVKAVLVVGSKGFVDGVREGVARAIALLADKHVVPVPAAADPDDLGRFYAGVVHFAAPPEGESTRVACPPALAEEIARAPGSKFVYLLDEESDEKPPGDIARACVALAHIYTAREHIHAHNKGLWEASRRVMEQYYRDRHGAAAEAAEPEDITV